MFDISDVDELVEKIQISIDWIASLSKIASSFFEWNNNNRNNSKIVVRLWSRKSLRDKSMVARSESRKGNKYRSISKEFRSFVLHETVIFASSKKLISVSMR